MYKDELMKKGINIVLALVTVGLAYYLGNIIYVPIHFTGQFDKRQEVIKNDLAEIRDLQMHFKTNNKRFAKNFGELRQFLDTDTFTVTFLKEVGFNAKNEPIYDTSYAYTPVQDSLKLTDSKIASIGAMPFSNNKEYALNAGDLTKGKITVQVFEVKAMYEDFLHDLDASQYDPKDDFHIGSMYEASYAGNW